MKKVILFATVISALLINACGGGGSDGSNALYPPALPTDLTVSEMDPETVTIQWTDNADNESGYDIERSVNGGNYAPVAQTGADETEFSESLADNTIYTYRVRAYNSAGDSGYSNEESVKRSKSAIAEIDAETGGTVELTGLATITFPAESLEDDETLIAMEGIKGDSVTQESAPYFSLVSDVKPISIVDFTSGDAELNKNVNLVMKYDPDLVTSINNEGADNIAELVSRGIITQADADKMVITTNDLDIYYFNPITNKWIKCNAVYDSVNNTFSLSTSYLGIYCIGYSQAEKTGVSIEENPELQKYLINSFNETDEYLEENNYSGKASGTCPGSCAKNYSSKGMKGDFDLPFYHEGCDACPESMDIDGDGDEETHIPAADGHGEKKLGCDFCTSPGDITDAMVGFIFRPACAYHDCCYRHGYPTYGKKQHGCNLRFLADMEHIVDKVYPLFGTKKISLTPWGPTIPINYFKFWNLHAHLGADGMAYIMYLAVEGFSPESSVGAYQLQPCFDYRETGVDCSLPILHDINIAETSTYWCEPGGSIQLEAGYSNRELQPISFTWNATTGTFDDPTADNVTWTAPATIDDDTEVTITLIMTNGAYTPTKTIKVKIFKPYTITYYGNGADSGTVPAAQDHIYYGSAVKLAANSGGLVKNNYNFGGWNTTPDGSGFDRPAGSFIIMGKADVMLYAKWTMYSVVYNGNGNTGGSVPIDSYNYQVNDTVTILGPGNLTRGYDTFWCWNTAYDGSGTNYFPDGTFIFESNTTLFAKWLWTRVQYVDGQYYTTAVDVIVDPNNTIYITGFTTGNLEGQTLTGAIDLFITKYSSTGIKQWTKLLGVSGEKTYPSGMAFDSYGNIYITGYTEGNLDGQFLTGYRDLFITKYNSAGSRQWTKLLGVGAAYTYGNDIAMDVNDNIYITGRTKGNLDGQTLTGYDDAFIVKYDFNGVKQWTKLLGVNGAMTIAYAIVLDSNTNIYITGYTNGNLGGQTLTGTYDSFIARFDYTGAVEWVKLFGVDSVATQASSIILDSAKNIYITGSTQGSLDGQSLNGTCDSFITKYDTSGSRQWTRLLGVSEKITVGLDIAFDASNNIYITGRTNGNLNGHILIGTQDIFVVRYNPSGIVEWTNVLGVSGATTSSAGIKIDTKGLIYVIGTTHGNFDDQAMTGTTGTFITTKFNQ